VKHTNALYKRTQYLVKTKHMLSLNPAVTGNKIIAVFKALGNNNEFGKKNKPTNNSEQFIFFCQHHVKKCRKINITNTAIIFKICNIQLHI